MEKEVLQFGERVMEHLAHYKGVGASRDCDENDLFYIEEVYKERRNQDIHPHHVCIDTSWNNDKISVGVDDDRPVLFDFTAAKQAARYIWQQL